jgi:hypothetical protein
LSRGALLLLSCFQGTPPPGLDEVAAPPGRHGSRGGRMRCACPVGVQGAAAAPFALGPRQRRALDCTLANRNSSRARATIEAAEESRMAREHGGIRLWLPSWTKVRSRCRSALSPSRWKGSYTLRRARARWISIGRAARPGAAASHLARVAGAHRPRRRAAALGLPAGDEAGRPRVTAAAVTARRRRALRARPPTRDGP